MKPDPLAKLRVRFCERARGDADGLAAALADSDHLRIEALAHGLAGAAGLFGFADIGVRAKRIDSLYAESETPSATEIEDLIATIRRDMDAYS